MIEVLPFLVAVAIIGAGLVTGLLFAFSNFALDALAELESKWGMFAMQRINRRIQNPLFFLLFFGTPLVCSAIVVISVVSPEMPARWLLVAGAGLYLAGPFAITALHNVPLNKGLDAADWSNADRVWPAYRRRWQFWNHVRTVLGILALAMLSIGAVEL